jgi:hypothetical protein
MTKEKNKRVNLRLPEDLYHKIKERYGNNLSSILRKQFEKKIQNDTLKDWTCFFCKNKEDYDINELWVSSFAEEKDNWSVCFIVCPKCRNNLLSKQLKDLSLTEQLVRVLFENGGKKGTLQNFVELTEHFPNKWRHKLGTIACKLDSPEELEEQFKHINTQNQLKNIQTHIQEPFNITYKVHQLSNILINGISVKSKWKKQ